MSTLLFNDPFSALKGLMLQIDSLLIHARLTCSQTLLVLRLNPLLYLQSLEMLAVCLDSTPFLFCAKPSVFFNSTVLCVGVIGGSVGDGVVHHKFSTGCSLYNFK